MAMPRSRARRGSTPPFDLLPPLARAYSLPMVSLGAAREPLSTGSRILAFSFRFRAPRSLRARAPRAAVGDTDCYPPGFMARYFASSLQLRPTRARGLSPSWMARDAGELESLGAPRRARGRFPRRLRRPRGTVLYLGDLEGRSTGTYLRRRRARTAPLARSRRVRRLAN